MTMPASTDGSRGARDLEQTRKQLQDMDRLLEEMLALPIGDRPRRTLEDLDTPPEPEGAALTLATFTKKTPGAEEAGRMANFRAMPERTDSGAPITPPDQQSHLDLESMPDAAPGSQQLHILSIDRHELSNSQSFADPFQGEEAPAKLTSRELLELVGLTEKESRALVARQTPPGVLHWFLIGINAGYERLADWLWPFGGLLKWIGTRYLLGFVGVLLLVGALVWLGIGRFGWTW